MNPFVLSFTTGWTIIHLTVVLLHKDCCGPAITNCYESYCLAPELHYIIWL